MGLVERKVIVETEVGLHSRPAAEFVRAAASAPFEVTVAKAGGAPVNAKSILAVLTLDVRSGDQIDVRADGDGAEQLLENLAGICRRGGHTTYS